MNRSFINKGLFLAILICTLPNSLAMNEEDFKDNPSLNKKSSLHQEGFVEKHGPKIVGSLAKMAIDSLGYPLITKITGVIGKTVFGTETLTEGLAKTGIKYASSKLSGSSEQNGEPIAAGQNTLSVSVDPATETNLEGNPKAPIGDNLQLTSPPSISPKINENEQDRRYTILSLDGGGIRGIGTLQMLKNLEERTGKTIQNIYDGFVGTSTGGIIAICFAKGITATQLLELYYNEGDKIFETSWWHEITTLRGYWGPRYDAEKITELADKFLHKGKVSSVEKPFAVTTSFTKGGKFFKLLKSHKDLDVFNPKLVNENLSTLVRMTSAAPTYFEGVNLNGSIAVDGGVAANDPSLPAYTYAQRLFGKDANIHLHSFGTGDVSEEARNATALSPSAGKLAAASKVPGLCMSGASSKTQHTMKRLLGERYKRFQFNTSEEIDLADVSKKDALIEYANAASRLPHFDNLVTELRDDLTLVAPMPVLVLSDPAVAEEAPETTLVPFPAAAEEVPDTTSVPSPVAAEEVPDTTPVVPNPIAKITPKTTSVASKRAAGMVAQRFKSKVSPGHKPAARVRKPATKHKHVSHRRRMGKKS